MIVRIADAETIVRDAGREIGLLVARDEVTITVARCGAGERIAGPHVHRGHTDAFYVLEGELTFEIGREAETLTVSAGGLVAAPPQVAHAFRTDGDRPARWLTIHARDGGFAAFMRGNRDGVRVEWDISAVPAGGGLPVRDAIVDLDAGDGDERPGTGRPGRLRCSLPDLCVVEWHLDEAHPTPSLRRRDDRIDSFFVLEGALEATLAQTTRVVGPGTLISVPRHERYTLTRRGPEPVRMLSIHTPGGGDAADAHRPSL